MSCDRAASKKGLNVYIIDWRCPRLLRRATAVSYTHLDVYKRQLYSQNALADLAEQCLLGVPMYNKPLVSGNPNDLPVHIQADKSDANYPDNAVFSGNVNIDVYKRQRNDSPITRVMFNPGDTITSHDGWQLKIDEVKEENGLLIYIGTRLDTEEANVVMREVLLDSKLTFSKPQDRLFAGQIDRMDPVSYTHLDVYKRQILFIIL